jgi:tRNA pseudouridine38-40 synthase
VAFMLYKYFLKIAYDGSPYCGWQIQPNALTVQQKLQETLQIFCDLVGDTLGCGRTDTGVHALVFYLHFTCKTQIENKHEFIFKLNRVLPESIAVYELYNVGNNAHCRFDAVSRTYQYHILQKKNPFIKNAWYNTAKLNIDLMNEGSKLLMQYQDFTSFSKSNTQVFTNNCHISHAQWEQKNDLLVFTIQANRFLRNMVRAVVGSLVDLGKQKYDLAEFKSIIESKNRSKAGLSVPAQGLFLTEVNYPKNYFEEQAKLFKTTPL